MRRVITIDKVSARLRFYENGKEVGNIAYNMQEGHFYVFTWPPSFSALRKAQELIRLLGFAIKVIKAEKCS